MIVYVDVDDTLFRSAGSKRIPMPDVISHVRRLKQDGVKLYCWSAGGGDYAREAATEAGLSDVFEAFLPKPRVMIDDQRLENWPFCITVHPTWCKGKSWADYSDPNLK